jgi:hypothetical protein
MPDLRPALFTVIVVPRSTRHDDGDLPGVRSERWGVPDVSGRCKWPDLRRDSGQDSAHRDGGAPASSGWNHPVASAYRASTRRVETGPVTASCRSPRWPRYDEHCDAVTPDGRAWPSTTRDCLAEYIGVARVAPDFCGHADEHRRDRETIAGAQEGEMHHP